jgi:L-alanine-DL-glutamate epimerase-like enolase superfamily enzyme
VANRPPIADGMLRLPDGPGWGLELDREVERRLTA